MKSVLNNTNIIKVFTLLILLVISSCSSKNENDSLKVLSFNIRYGNADDGENSWKFRKDQLFDLIKYEKADIIGLQEALEFQIKEITEQIKDYNFIGVGRDDGKSSGEFSAILYNKSKLKLLESNTFWFSETPDSIASKSWGNDITRICSWGKFAAKTNMDTFFVFNVHLDHISENSRIKSAELLIKIVNEKAVGKPIIITGDFNADENTPEIKVIKQYFVDTFRIINPKVNPAGTFHNFTGISDGRKIDYIFINEKFKVESANILKNNNNGKYPSDHYPVNAKLLFN